MKNAVLIALISTTASAAWADPRAAALDRIEASEPTLEQTRRAALRYAGLAERSETSWSQRARLSALLPVLTVEIDRGTEQDRDLSRSSTGTERLDLGSDREVSVEARAVWNLDRLVFSDLELRAHKAARARHGERAQLLTRVTALYFQRRKMQIATLWAPAGAPGKRALERLAIAELTAQLDALTGGYFSRALSRG